MEEREDTLSLLRECNSGIQMGVSAIEDVIDKIESPKLKEELESSMKEHERLGNETHDLLNELGEKVEETHPIAKEMSKMKTSVKMALDENDKTAAGLISDGCHMGIKSLSKYLNMYEKAGEKSKDIARKLIYMEDSLDKKMRFYL